MRIIEHLLVYCSEQRYPLVFRAKQSDPFGFVSTDILTHEEPLLACLMDGLVLQPKKTELYLSLRDHTPRKKAPTLEVFFFLRHN